MKRCIAWLKPFTHPFFPGLHRSESVQHVGWSMIEASWSDEGSNKLGLRYQPPLQIEL